MDGNVEVTDPEKAGTSLGLLIPLQVKLVDKLGDRYHEFGCHLERALSFLLILDGLRCGCWLLLLLLLDFWFTSQGFQAGTYTTNQWINRRLRLWGNIAGSGAVVFPSSGLGRSML